MDRIESEDQLAALAMHVEGYTSREIADRLSERGTSVEPATVRQWLSRIPRRLG